ncbi:phage tail protein [Burkholderia ambifaria]|uniref:phage tail protein n=1 Tax=Burkholderia ambifaria TaxID=152480 RepID=UPI001B932C7F|nr:phage tail protein [Burkholderia ambifaria]MBR8182085.1 phage tail protein [Burkholderia ambifaria]
MTQQLLSDLSQWYGGDVSASATGDFQTATADTRSQQRIIRRLCTNPGDYIFHPDYGGGLPKLIGSNASVSEVRAIVQSQLRLEESILQLPAPVVAITPITAGMQIQIQYTDALTRKPVLLSFDVAI